jgi:PAS domain S-box-containing protein
VSRSWLFAPPTVRVNNGESLEDITDVGDRNRAKAALGESEQRFQLIVDSIPGLVCTMSPSGEVQLLNRQVLEYFDKTTEELKAWATSDAVHPDDLPRVLTTFAKSIETGQPYDIEHRCRRADGIYRWFQVPRFP